MRAEEVIWTNQVITPMIYAYTTPGYPKNDGWTKIGYTEQGVKKRIEQQTHTAGLDYEILWSDFARYKDDSGEWFKDYDFHHFLETNKKSLAGRERSGSRSAGGIRSGISLNLPAEGT